MRTLCKTEWVLIICIVLSAGIFCEALIKAHSKLDTIHGWLHPKQPIKITVIRYNRTSDWTTGD